MDRRNFLINLLFSALSFVFGYKVGNSNIKSIGALNEELAHIATNLRGLFVNILKPPSGITPAATDGTTDISTTLQACVDYVNANGGGYVYLPFQTTGFTIANRVNWKSNVGLISNGSILTIPSKTAGFQVFYLLDCSNVNFIGKLRMKSTNDKTRAIGRAGLGSNAYGIYIGGNSQEIYIDYVYGENLEYVVDMQGTDGSANRNVLIKEVSFHDTYQPVFINRFANVNIQYIRGVIQNIQMDPLDHVVYINDACTDIVFDTIQASNLNTDNSSWAVQINPTSFDETKRNKRITFNKIHLDGSFSGFVAALTEGVWVGEFTANLNGANSVVLGAYSGAKYEIGNITIEGSYATFLTCLGDSTFMNEVSIRGGRVNASGSASSGSFYIVRGEYINKLNINNVEFNNITTGGTSFFFPSAKGNNQISFFHCRFNFQTALVTYPFTIGSGNAEFKECKFINTQTLYDQVVNVTTGADAKVIRCTLVNFKTFLYWNMTGTGRVFESVLLDDNSIVNGINNKEVKTFYGSGSPEGVVTAKQGSVFFRNDGGAGTTYYVKESGTGNTGWIGK